MILSQIQISAPRPSETSGATFIVVRSSKTGIFSLIKNFRLTEGQSLRFTADFFNLWNHANFASPAINDVSAIGTILPDGKASGPFGKILSTVGTPRLIQFSVAVCILVSGRISTTRIPLLERDQVTPEIANVYDALPKARGVVPNMFKTLAHTPALALATAGYLKALLSDGALAGWYKELIATRVSVLNGSEYAVSAHALSARQKGASEDQIAAVKSDYEQGPFTPTEKLGLSLR